MSYLHNMGQISTVKSKFNNSGLTQSGLLIVILILGIFIGVIVEKIDLPLKLQMWGSFYTLPNKKHVGINCWGNNELHITTDDRKNFIDVVCYPQ